LIHIRLTVWLLVAAFLFAKGAASAHAVEHGFEHDHDHDLPCAVYVLAEDQTPLPDPVEADAPTVEERPEPVLQPAHVVSFRSTVSCRAPPPRAPPR
jgi:hypothetical protein